MKEIERVHFRHQALSVIEALMVAKAAGRRRRRLYQQLVPLGYFQNIDPTFLLYHGDGDPDLWWYGPDETTPEVLWPIDTTYMRKPRESDEPGDDGTPEYQLIHVRSVRPAEVRGKTKLVGRYMLETTQARLDGEFGQQLQMVGSGRHYEVYQGHRWITDVADWADRPFAPQLSAKDWIRSNMAISVALRQRYEWAVSLGYDDSPSVRLRVDPTAIKDLFKFRDVPSGERRREILLRWIDDNWRRSRSDPEIETYVRQHLRGGSRFNWHGLGVSILLPEFDSQMEERLISERLAMKAAGTDKRRRAP